MAKKLDSLSISRKKSTENPAVVAEEKQVDTQPAPEEATVATEEVPALQSTEPSKSDSFEELFPEPSVTVNRPPAWVLWLLLLIASLAVATIGFKAVNGKIDGWLSVSPSPTSSPSPSLPAATETPTATPSPETTATPIPSPSATATATPAATSTPSSIKKSSITLRVLNGTKKAGAASTLATKLEKDGFTVRTTGNAKQQDYPSTMVYYQAGRKAEAELVQESLGAYETTLQQSTLANPDMVLVVIGAE